MESWDFLAHQAVQGTLVDCKSNLGWGEWQRKNEEEDPLWSLACAMTRPNSSPSRAGIKRPTPDSSCLTSPVHNGFHELSNPFAPTSSSLPVPKFQVRDRLSRCSSSSFPAANKEEFCSPTQSSSNGEIVHPFTSPFQSLNSSPATSISTENNLYYQEEKPFPIFTTNEDLIGSHGSSSSEVVGSGDGYNELNILMESMLYESFGEDRPDFTNYAVDCGLLNEELGNSAGEAMKVVPDLAGEIQKAEEQMQVLPDVGALGLPFTSCDADVNGIRLVHLLIASAEAVASRDRDLASVILARLKELVFRRSNTMERVASYFADGLRCRLEGGRALERAAAGNTSESQKDILAAFQILHEVSPFIKFGHFTANQAILDAVEGDRRVHIVDYDIMEGIQWPSLMQALVTRKEGPPHLRITALYRAHAKRGLSTVQETGKRLTEFAASLNLPFTFNQARVDNDEDFRPSAVKVMRGGALVVNCMLHLPHMHYRTSTSVSSFLHGIRKLRPSIVTLVEDELGFTTSAFTTHFFEALHHYSAIFDSLEATLSSTQTTARTLVEQVFFASRINSTITFCGSSSKLPEGRGHSQQQVKQNWSSLVMSAGFKALPFSVNNICQARLLLGLFKDGYKLEEDNNRLLLGWRCKPLFAASAWSYE